MGLERNLVFLLFSLLVLSTSIYWCEVSRSVVVSAFCAFFYPPLLLLKIFFEFAFSECIESLSDIDSSLLDFFNFEELLRIVADTPPSIPIFINEYPSEVTMPKVVPYGF